MTMGGKKILTRRKQLLKDLGFCSKYVYKHDLLMSAPSKELNKILN